MIHFSPIFIVSPTARCGTTLLQRLLNSSGQMVIFGEDSMISQCIPDLLFGLRQRTEKMEGDLAFTRKKFVEETTEFWSNGLLPPSGKMLEAAMSWFEQVMQISQDSAKGMGRERWGYKFPLRIFDDVELFLQLLENCRILFIYRNIYDVVRSYKARGWIKEMKDVGKVSFQWQHNMLQALDFQHKNFFLLSYEDLVENPEKQITCIEEFLEMSGISRQVMEVKINSWPEKGKEGRSLKAYVAPEKLCEKEEKVVERFAKKALMRVARPK